MVGHIGQGEGFPFFFFFFYLVFTLVSLALPKQCGCLFFFCYVRMKQYLSLDHNRRSKTKIVVSGAHSRVATLIQPSFQKKKSHFMKMCLAALVLFVFFFLHSLFPTKKLR